MTTKRLLTEAEILKMSDKDYMNEDQLAFFKNRLEQLQADILRNAGQTTENLRETVIVPDPADRATIEEEHALELRTRDRERKLLKKVQQSIARIESGEYGWCEETGEPIGIPRLLARPTATLSLEAQERRELRQKLFEPVLEEGELILVHVILVAHLQDFGFSQESFRRHLACFFNVRQTVRFARTFVLPA
jgi:DnaK suppressor protein